MKQQDASPVDTANNMVEIAFVSAVNILTKKYGCKLVSCDYDKRQLEIEGPEDAQLKVALGLDKFLSQWEVKEPAYDWKKIDDNIRVN